MASASEREGCQNSKNVVKFILGQKLRELEHFEISKIPKKFLKVNRFQDFFENDLKLKIGRGAEGAAKFSRKRSVGANLGRCNVTNMRF